MPQKSLSPAKRAAYRKSPKEILEQEGEGLEKLHETLQETLMTPEHHEHISVAAYFLAQEHEFQGDPMAYWLAAESSLKARR